MYTLEDYLAMVADGGRTEAYLGAMRATIRPGDVVLELGTGFGYFAVQAALMGARQVYAIEPEDAVALGPELAAANGVADRVRFLQGYSTRLDLPERADLLIEDMRGASPLFAGRLSALLDARQRHLNPGARVIPRLDRLQLSPATAPSTLGRHARALAQESRGVDLSPVLARAGTGWRQIDGGEAVPLAPTATWAEIDYATFTGLSVQGSARMVVERSGRLEGFVSSFAADLAEGFAYSTAPSAERMVYDAGWFPLAEPVECRPGDGIAIRMRGTHDGADYVWSWTTTVTAADGRFKEVEQRQDNLADILIAPGRLKRRTADHVPVRGRATEIRQLALTLADGRRTVGEVAEEVHARFPGAFPDGRAALRAVAEWLADVEESAGP